MTTPSADVFEKIASFYLGRHFNLDDGEMTDDLLMYDAKDLCTHAMCVGMTGSGKTGLCVSLLEEAAIDGIPAICVDPKGDLANLLLTFPELAPGDFEPWIDPGQAQRQGVSTSELAEKKATLWREGLASWGQSPERIAKLKQAVDVAIYTPGSNIGIPMTVLKSFDAPPESARHDTEALGDRVTGSVSGLLTLMGIEADPLTSPEHILLSSILNHQWIAGKNVAISQLIRLIQNPPMSRIGVVDIDSFMSEDQRNKLAMRLNNLLASPAFASWLEGQTLSIDSLLHTPSGKPRISILSIAHLSDTERMFFVTILLNELVAWMRCQTGTSSLRSIFYMDEVAGYFPPVSNPPCKPPMLTLLKQARAFGLGITLATQNPVDLDYKGLSNIGTWFLGRLQTERDKARVLEGLEGASNQSGQPFDRSEMERVLAGLGSRVFLMNNVHDGFPTVFQTRWAMSYLAGPLARGQISDLMHDRKTKELPASEIVDTEEESADSEQSKRPIIPAGIKERFVELKRQPAIGKNVRYRPAIAATGSLHFVRKTADLDCWKDVACLVEARYRNEANLWKNCREILGQTDIVADPEPNSQYADIPAEWLSKRKHRSFKSQWKEHLYRNFSRSIYRCPLVKGYSSADNERDAKAEIRLRLREKRDAEIEKLRDKYAARLRSLEKKIHTAETRVDREKGQSRTSMISAGSSILGALVGNFLGGRRTRVSTVARKASYASQQSSDVRRAEEALEMLHEDRDELNRSLAEDLDALNDKYGLDQIELEALEIAPRKSDLKVDDPYILWLPFGESDDGQRIFLG